MVLDMTGSGKILTKRYFELHNEAYDDESLLSDQEKTFADTANMTIKDVNPIGGNEVELHPSPWYDMQPGKLIDIRKIADPTLQERH